MGVDHKKLRIQPAWSADPSPAAKAMRRHRHRLIAVQCVAAAIIGGCTVGPLVYLALHLLS